MIFVAASVFESPARQPSNCEERTMTRSILKQLAPILLGAMTMSGCATEITSSLKHSGPVGSYTSIILYSTSVADTTNQTPLSGVFNISLAPDGSTSGHLQLGAFNGNPAVDADMTGTWTRTGNTIQFQQPAATFVRDMSFTIQKLTDSYWWLVGDDVYAGTRYNVMLAHCRTPCVSQ
jgi:hypothetical protein